MKFGESAESQYGDEEGLRRRFHADGKTMEEWHLKLLRELRCPIKTYAWFSTARLVGDKLYFDGATPRGTICYDWVRKTYSREMVNALGKVEICLASRGAIIKRVQNVE